MFKLFIKHYSNKLTFSNQLWWIFDKVFRRFFFQKKIVDFFCSCNTRSEVDQLTFSSSCLSSFLLEVEKKRQRVWGGGGGTRTQGQVMCTPRPTGKFTSGIYRERERVGGGWEIGLLLIAKHIHTHTLKLSFFNSLI